MHRLTALASAALLAGLSSAQERVDVLYRESALFVGPTVLGVIELDAGAAAPVSTTDLQVLTPFPIDFARCVEHVGAEVWVGTRDGVLRYGGSPLAYLGRALSGERILSMAPAPFGAIASVQTFGGPGGPVGSMVELDGGGAEIRRVDTSPRLFTDLAAYQGGYLGMGANDIVRLDANYAVLGDFAADAPTVAAQRGLQYFPEQITVLDDGRVAITATFSFAVIETNGTVDDVYFASFAFDAQPTGGGPLAVLARNGLYLHDTEDFDFVGGIAPGWLENPRYFSTRYTAPSPGATERLCTTVANSTGAAARLHLVGSDSETAQRLSTIATDLPPGTFGLPIYGPAPTDVALGDGRLCLSPFTPGLTRGPVARATADGTLLTGFDFVTPGLGAGFVAGTTWYYQVLFRDTGPNGLNGTDSVSIRFVP
ncbi:MAG: hypothetical protein AAGB93_24625 [Planctomycetota bacterium]